MTVTKRNAAPRFWPLSVKEKKYVISPTPGPHNKTECIPLVITLRDFLKIARNSGEVKSLANSGIVRVNGVPRKDLGFPLGIMDVLEVEGDFYRIVPSKYGLKPVKVEDGGIKLSKIVNKTIVKEKKLQLNFHDGTNMLVEKDDFWTSDVVAIDINEGTIKDTFRFDKGSYAVVTDGNNRGLVGKIENIDKKLKTVTIENKDGKYLVPIRYVFVVGHHSKPEVSLGE